MGEPFALAISALCSLLKHPPNMEAHLAVLTRFRIGLANRQGKTWAELGARCIASLQPWRIHPPRALWQLASAEQTSSPQRSSVPAREALSCSPLYLYKTDHDELALMCSPSAPGRCLLPPPRHASCRAAVQLDPLARRYQSGLAPRSQCGMRMSR